jgi:hypothetical protein
MQFVESDRQGQLHAAAFRDGLEKAGWVAGRNISVDYFWRLLDTERTRDITEQFREKVPNVIVINSSVGLADNVGAVIGGVSGLFLAGPPGAIIGVIIGDVFGRPFWGPHSPYACWIDERWHRHCPSVALRRQRSPMR